MGPGKKYLILGVCLATAASVLLISAGLPRNGVQVPKSIAIQWANSWWDDAARRPECHALRSTAARIRTIAVVGNGPLSDLQRGQIAASDVVIRFNKLNNRFCGERMHIWAVRFAEHAPVKYHGLAEVAHCKTEEALQTASALWFLDGAGKQREAAIAALRLRWPVLAQKTLVPLDHGMLAQRYERLLGAPGNPSSGWSGMMLALECAPSQARIHLFGFNWSLRHWSRHRMAAEEAHARRLHGLGRVFIHDPICGGLRACGNCSVVADFDESGFICSNATYGEGDLPWAPAPATSRNATANAHAENVQLWRV